MQTNRVASGGRINRGNAVNFTFNGKAYQGFAGDTLAAALLANGVDIVGRSFKYGRPRGIVGHGAEEPNAIVQLGSGAQTVPNLRATQVELYEGLEAHSVGGWPSVDFDVREVLGFMGKMMPPGFYYKTFMRPQNLWHFYERWIRKAAGLGKAPLESDPDCYDKLNQNCDVLVVGAGPAGLAAASAAARAGARVIIADEQQEFGGSLLASQQQIDGQPAMSWVDERLAELGNNDNVMLLPRSTVFGYYDHNFLGILERRTDHLGISSPGQVRQRMHRVRAKQVVLATGAIERPLVFANNDLPGVMMASSVSTYLNRYGVAAGNNLVLFTTNDNAYQTAIDWHKAGRKVVKIVDSRPEPTGALVNTAREFGIDVMAGHVVVEAKGRRRVKGAMVAPLNDNASAVAGAAIRLDCDLLACSGGWSPAIHLSSHTGAKPQWNDELVGFVPGESKQQERSAGSAKGAYSLAGCLQQGDEAGREAARKAGLDGESTAASYQVDEQPQQPQQAMFLVPHAKSTSRAPVQFVDFQLDVTAAAIELAAREGYESVEHVKRYTAMGFGTDQGKLGNINGMAILARALGRGIPETGTTIFRPSYTPTTFGAIAGRDVADLFDPERYTAMQRWHQQQGAEFENVGQWKRPWYYPKPGETMHDAVNRECLAVRNSVGMLDASTLGKIDIQGPDAGEFLNRMYTNAYAKLAPGKCRYGLMLKEDGMIFDDGVTACLGPNHYLMFTTTGGAAAVLAWLELWQQTEWPELQVYFTSVTDHWATATVTGPNARKVIEKVCDDIDLSNEAFPFMDWRDATVAGVSARIFRISFTGELSLEVNVPAHHGRYVWEKLVEAGEEFGITPYGTETMHVLRAEKGFIIVGQDTDGSMTPADMGMNWVVSQKKEFSFIGKRSLSRSDMLREDRKQLVGLKTRDPQDVLPEGAQIVNQPEHAPPVPMQGHVTSSYYSANLGHSIALAVVKGGHKRMGETVYCPLADGRVIEAEIVSSIFYDPKGERQNV
ncbi:sarcosine oxidase subunit alpha [Porticoccus sp. W117]|uniref:sarcosine oxidase subunit alpha n=1 Tax=Porticoccus sp. W117 TaxID=3054777 RepID=UPI0025998E18|nr:sarcosine oxidase subunit alpha [Porticoccus sp. W117]MDM3871383.1 sarcosine oxidase subunit alpha [Porticoccus sp. W117]